MTKEKQKKNKKYSTICKLIGVCLDKLIENKSKSLKSLMLNVDIKQWVVSLYIQVCSNFCYGLKYKTRCSCSGLLSR